MDRSHRSRADHAAQAGRRPHVVPGRRSHARLRDAGRRPTRRHVRTRRLPRCAHGREAERGCLLCRPRCDPRRTSTADGGWVVGHRPGIAADRGVCWEGEIDEVVAAIVAACDGTASLGTVLPTPRMLSMRTRRRLPVQRFPLSAGWSSRASCSRKYDEAQIFLFCSTSKFAVTAAPSLPEVACGE